MITLPRYRRMLLLTEGQLGMFTSKTAAVLLRYRADDVAGFIDAAAAGRKSTDILAGLAERPIFASFEAARAMRPDALVIGVAPVGGQLPAAMRRAVAEALHAGVDVVSGLHAMLAEDAELSEAARGSGAAIHDVRRAPAGAPIAAFRAKTTRGRRILTVGTDCNVGKMTVALELARAASAAQRREARGGGGRHASHAAFVATGQTGIMVEGWGVAIDHVISDFVAGAVEELVLSVADRELIFVEGQGSILHPAYSGVTLSLMHGACPDAMILVHHAGRTHYRAHPGVAIPDVRTQIQLYEAAMAPIHACRVAAVAVNTYGMDDESARRAIDDMAQGTGLPADDVVRFGAQRIMDCLQGRYARDR